MIVSDNLSRLMGETNCFMDKKWWNYYYPKLFQAYITILLVGAIQRKAQPQQTQVQDNLITCAEAHNSQQTIHRNL